MYKVKIIIIFKKSNFIDWGSGYYDPIKDGHRKTTIENLKFYGKSSYQDDFQEFKVSDDTNNENFKPTDHNIM